MVAMIWRQTEQEDPAENRREVHGEAATVSQHTGQSRELEK